MRTRLHMASMLAAVGAVAPLLATAAASAAVPKDSDPVRKNKRRLLPTSMAPTRLAILQTGKPPTNGKREVERRLRQAARKAEKDAKR